MYHSGDCREAYYKKKYGSAIVEKVCAYCNATFPTTKPRKQKYCTEDCRTAAQAKARDEKEARQRAEIQTYREEVADALFKDGYKCAKCRKSASMDGVKLVVVPDGEKLKTLCADCAKEESNADTKDDSN